MPDRSIRKSNGYESSQRIVDLPGLFWFSPDHSMNGRGLKIEDRTLYTCIDVIDSFLKFGTTHGEYDK